MTIGSFCLIKNEKTFIRAHLDEWLPHLDSMAFFDGNSTDGTLEILQEYAAKTPKVILYQNKDPQNFAEDYEKLSNECLRICQTDMGLFLHPDMFPENGEILKYVPEDTISATVTVRSFAGWQDEHFYEVFGRGQFWKNLYRLHNPDLGAHYHGFYGAQNEDVYFSEITGSSHKHFGQELDKYPYKIYNSGLVIRHYSDVRPYTRRLERMECCLINQGHSPDIAKQIAPVHPRVSLKDGQGFRFLEVQKPVFLMEGAVS